MLKNFVFYFAVFCLIFVSCKNGDIGDMNQNSSSLKSVAEKKITETDWTFELEKDRLAQDISVVNSIEKKIKLTPQVFLNSAYSKNLEPVFPCVEGFGSLNTSNFNSEIKKMTEEFASSLCKNKFASNLFDSSDIYELALFSIELKNRWEKTFDFPYPEIDEKKSEELQNQEKTGENSSDAEKQTVQEIILFDEYILGEPFEMNSLCEVPVRFVQKKGFVDVVLYFFKNPNGNWKINQLHILKMQKKFKKDVR